MIIDGRKIADEIRKHLKKEVMQRERPPALFIISVGENPVTEKFLAQKKKFANVLGVAINERRFSEDVRTKTVVETITRLSSKKNSGIIVQLPLPQVIDTQAVLNAIPSTHDVDALSQESVKRFEEGTLKILPPVAGVIKEILDRNNVVVGGKKVVIIGKGRLVGVPAEIWFRQQGANVTVFDRHTLTAKRFTLDADIIVSGAGSPGLIKPEMIKDDVVLLDAGTSTSTPLSTGEDEGRVVGDADPRCEELASIFTPVPGGIGPITVAMVFKNLFVLTKGN